MSRKLDEGKMDGFHSSTSELNPWSFCHRDYSTTQHIQQTTRVSPSCAVCAKGFTQVQQMNYHLRTHAVGRCRSRG